VQSPPLTAGIASERENDLQSGVENFSARYKKQKFDLFSITAMTPGLQVDIWVDI